MYLVYIFDLWPHWMFLFVLNIYYPNRTLWSWQSINIEKPLVSFLGQILEF